MSRATSPEKNEALSENQKNALVKLLADDDLAVYHTIRSKILSFGSAASGWLRPHTLSSDPVLRRRTHELVQYLARQEADNRFLAFCLNQGEDLDVEEGAWLLSQTQYPDINLAAYQALFDTYAGDLRERIDFGGTPETIWLLSINTSLPSSVLPGTNPIITTRTTAT